MLPVYCIVLMRVEKTNCRWKYTFEEEITILRVIQGDSKTFWFTSKLPNRQLIEQMCRHSCGFGWLQERFHTLDRKSLSKQDLEYTVHESFLFDEPLCTKHNCCINCMACLFLLWTGHNVTYLWLKFSTPVFEGDILYRMILEYSGSFKNKK